MYGLNYTFGLNLDIFKNRKKKKNNRELYECQLIEIKYQNRCWPVAAYFPSDWPHSYCHWSRWLHSNSPMVWLCHYQRMTCTDMVRRVVSAERSAASVQVPISYSTNSLGGPLSTMADPNRRCIDHGNSVKNRQEIQWLVLCSSFVGCCSCRSSRINSFFQRW